MTKENTLLPFPLFMLPREQNKCWFVQRCRKDSFVLWIKFLFAVVSAFQGKRFSLKKECIWALSQFLTSAQD